MEKKTREIKKLWTINYPPTACLHVSGLRRVVKAIDYSKLKHVLSVI